MRRMKGRKGLEKGNGEGRICGSHWKPCGEISLPRFFWRIQIIEGCGNALQKTPDQGWLSSPDLSSATHGSHQETAALTGSEQKSPWGEDWGLPASDSRRQQGAVVLYKASAMFHLCEQISSSPLVWGFAVETPDKRYEQHQVCVCCSAALV